MRRQHRLRPPQVGVARDDEALLAGRKSEECPLQFEQPQIDPIDRPPAVEPEVGRHLVIAAPGRVELPPGIAEPRRQFRLDVQMDIVLRRGERERARGDLLPDRFERLRNRGGLRGRHQAAGGEHLRMGDRAVDVVVGEPPVERHALRKCLHAFVGRLLKHAAPGLLRGCARCVVRTGLL